jgi:hypothetical protein
MKCSGLREYGKVSKPCGRRAKDEFDGFCSAEHRNDAEKYLGAGAFNTHQRSIKEVASNPNLIKAFNDQLRVQFVSMIEARKHSESQAFLNHIGGQYMQGMQSAWREADAVSGASAPLLLENAVTVAEIRRSAKRRGEAQNLASVLYERIASYTVLEIEDDSGGSSGRSSKRSKSRDDVGLLEDQPENEPVDPLTLSQKLNEVNLQNACNTPLPVADDDDDLMED